MIYNILCFYKQKYVDKKIDFNKSPCIKIYSLRVVIAEGFAEIFKKNVEYFLTGLVKRIDKLNKEFLRYQGKGLFGYLQLFIGRDHENFYPGIVRVDQPELFRPFLVFFFVKGNPKEAHILAHHFS